MLSLTYQVARARQAELLAQAESARASVEYARRACGGPATAPTLTNATSILDRRSREQRVARRRRELRRTKS